MTARTPSKLGISEERTCFCVVRRCVTTLRLRSVRLTLWRARLAADLVLAIADQKLLECGRSRAQLDCQPEKARLRSWSPSHSDASVTTVCSMPAWFFVAQQRAPHSFAFVRP